MISQNTKSFSQSFYLFVIGGYFLWPYTLQRDPKYLFSDSTEIRPAKRSTKYRCNSVRWINRKLSSFSESFSPDFLWGYFLFHHSPLRVSQYHLPFPQELSYRKASRGERCNSVRWFHRTQGSFSESFFLFVIGGYFLWTYSLQRDPKYLFADSTEIRLANRSTKNRCNSVSWINRTLSSSSENFFPDFIGGYFLFHHSPLLASKYHFANSTRTVLAKGFLRGKL